MTRYTPEFLAALRQGYEGSDQPMRQLARDFGIGLSTLSTLVEQEGWLKRSERPRGSPSAPRVAQAAALLATLPRRAADIGDYELAPHMPPAPDERSAAERLEALLVQEIAAEEAARAELGTLPRLRAEADGCTRRLAVLTQTLKTLRAISTDAPKAEDDRAPIDMDEFRETLARRVRGLILSRLGPERAALSKQFARLTDDEMKELAQVGRERGMRALLEPPPDNEDDMTEANGA